MTVKVTGNQGSYEFEAPRGFSLSENNPQGIRFLRLTGQADFNTFVLNRDDKVEVLG